MSRVVLAADVGGTNIRAAVVNESGVLIDERRAHARLSDPSVTEAMVVSQIADQLKALLVTHTGITAAGIGFPGFIAGDSGVVIASPNLPQLRDFDLAGRLARKLDMPVKARNDALCAAIGEQRFGAGKGHDNLLHVTLGTGIGGGLILNGAPYAGEGGMAMEFGHLRVVRGDDARACGCGGRGCVEAYASATAVAARYAEAGGTKTDAGDVFDRAAGGDKAARRVIEEAGSHLGAAIAEAVKLLDVHTVTISGGLTGAWPLLHPPLTAALDGNLIPPLKGKIEVLRSTLADNAGILGAAALASE